MSGMQGLAAFVFCAALAAPFSSAAGDSKSHGHGKPDRSAAPLVIAHRGASGYRPEHTLAAYALAIDMGADYIEPDLVSTKDGVLVARHENEISGTTDVADRPEFADRYATKTIDGVAISGWFTEDFTLAEIKTLRARERVPELRQANTLYDGRYEIPTLQEVIDLTQRKSRELRRAIGIYPETKHPSYFQSIGLPLEEPLVVTLDRYGYRHADSPVFIQSFEVANLKKLRAMTRVRLVQLISGSGRPYDFVLANDPRSYADLATPTGLAEIAGYADGIGPTKTLIVPRSGGASGTPTTLVEDARAAGLVVHPWTFRNENAFVPAELRLGDNPSAYGRAFDEYAQFYALGVDGVFSDNPDTAVEARRDLRQ